MSREEENNNNEQSAPADVADSSQSSALGWMHRGSTSRPKSGVPLVSDAYARQHAEKVITAGRLQENLLASLLEMTTKMKLDSPLVGCVSNALEKTTEANQKRQIQHGDSPAPVASSFSSSSMVG